MPTINKRCKPEESCDLLHRAIGWAQNRIYHCSQPLIIIWSQTSLQIIDIFRSLRANSNLNQRFGENFLFLDQKQRSIIPKQKIVRNEYIFELLGKQIKDREVLEIKVKIIWNKSAEHIEKDWRLEHDLEMKLNSKGVLRIEFWCLLKNKVISLDMSKIPSILWRPPPIPDSLLIVNPFCRHSKLKTINQVIWR